MNIKAVSIFFLFLSANLAQADPIVITDDDIDGMSKPGHGYSYEREEEERQPVNSPGIISSPQEARIDLPDSVRETWKAVILNIKDKQSDTASDFKVEIGNELVIPESGLKISVLIFIPEFQMRGLDITTGSNEPRNSVVKLAIYEKGNLVFKGFLFEKFPTTHTFSHPRFFISLKGGVRK